jgi:hypothetical protein
MAADSNLQRYFMSDYHRSRFDYRTYYELASVAGVCSSMTDGAS